MNAVQPNDPLIHAITYANRQIDNFVQRKRLTFTELALIVDALHTMSNVSGSLLLSYALLSRSKFLVLDEAGYFTMHDSPDTRVDHSIPNFLRDLPFYIDNKVKYDQIEQFVPMFALGLGATDVVLKNNIWVRSRERTDKHMPIVLSAKIEDAIHVNNRIASVLMPIVRMSGNEPVCSFLQVPATTFERIRTEATAAAKQYGEDGFALYLEATTSSRIPKVFSTKVNPKLVRENVHSVVGRFWMNYLVYAKAIVAQNEKMPKHVAEAVAMMLINMQKKPSELAAQIY
jgi:hypothetical protein